ncbi:hypothetical protein GCM10010300_11530 [Streptomyces olivaceoviridis]|nr:hypothetical protein GCM10010300_11530 [Streptomyces olivaceoviridis]
MQGHIETPAGISAAQGATEGRLSRGGDGHHGRVPATETVEASSNPNDKEPVDGVNSSRMNRCQRRKSSHPDASNGARHTGQMVGRYAT